MKIVIAPDSFKESMTALEAATAIEAGFKKVFPDADYVKVPMADGGEGTVQSIIDATDGELKPLTVTGPLGEPVKAFYGLSGDGKRAIIELAAASGLDKVPMDQRNPMLTTTYGFGELIKAALDEDIEEILLGIGGSATNDGGAGMIQSLDGQLLDEKGESIAPTGAGLAALRYIDLNKLHPRLQEVKLRVASDVANPLVGPNGAASIYGPQKGGTPKQIAQLDQNLTHFAGQIKKHLKKDVANSPGAGAAGGLGAGLLAFLDVELERGGEVLVDLFELEKEILAADLVITGEGDINHQTIFGKTPVAVSKVAKKHQVPVIAFAGILSSGYEAVYDAGIGAVFSILPELMSLEDALRNGPKNLEDTARNVAHLLKLKI